MPCARRALGDAVEHGVGNVVFGQRGRKLGEPGVGLDGEVIDRDVRWRERQRLREVGLEVLERLARQRVHQVEVEGVEGAGGLFHGGDGLGAVVHAAERRQVLVVEALHAHRQARDAGGAVRAKAVALEGAGVGFERDLAIGRELEARAHIAEQAVDGLRRKQAGRAAADEDGVDGAAPDERQRGVQVGQQRIDVARPRECPLHRPRWWRAIRAS
jgi:hypothetical protein